MKWNLNKYSDADLLFLYSKREHFTHEVSASFYEAHSMLV